MNLHSTFLEDRSRIMCSEKISVATLIGEKIRRERRSRKITSLQLSRVIGTSPQQITKYEVGRDSIRVSRLLLVANAIGCSAEEWISKIMLHLYPNAVYSEEHAMLLRQYRRNDGETVDVALGTIIRYFRRLDNLSAAELGSLAGIGQCQLYKYEVGHDRMRVDMFLRIFNALGVRPDLVIKSISTKADHN